MFQKTESSFAEPEGRDDIETVVGPSVQVEGDFASAGNIVVKGTVCGSVQTSQRLTVEEGARILANVKAGEAIISGQIKGNLRVAERLELTETAQILGDIACSTLAVAPGALISGKVAMKGIEIADPTKPTRKRTSRAKKTETPEEEADAE